MKLDFEIAVDRLTRTRDQTFEGVQPRPYLINFWPNYVKSPRHPKTDIMGALLVASGLRNLYVNV